MWCARCQRSTGNDESVPGCDGNFAGKRVAMSRCRRSRRKVFWDVHERLLRGVLLGCGNGESCALRGILCGSCACLPSAFYRRLLLGLIHVHCILVAHILLLWSDEGILNLPFVVYNELSPPLCARCDV